MQYSANTRNDLEGRRQWLRLSLDHYGSFIHKAIRLVLWFERWVNEAIQDIQAANLNQVEYTPPQVRTRSLARHL